VRQRITGVMMDGGYAEFAKAPASHVVKIPDALPSEQAAPLLCAGVTVHRALKQAKIRAGQRLAVFGVGGLGHLAVQIGRAAGAEVTAIDIAEEKLSLAKSLGAWRYIDSRAQDPSAELQKLGGAKVVLATVTAGDAMASVLGGLGVNGTLMVIGAAMQMDLSPAQLIGGSHAIKGWY